MKALTVRQPHATLIALGAKRIETRSWATAYRGPIAIHAGAAKPPTGLVVPRNTSWSVIDTKGDPWSNGADRYRLQQERPLDESRRVIVTAREDPRWHPMPLGAVLCVAQLVDVVPMTGRPTEGAQIVVYRDPDGIALYPDAMSCDAIDVSHEGPLGNYAPGGFGWILEDIEPIVPVPAKGKQGLWNWDPS